MCLFHCHLEHLIDVLFFVADIERPAVVALGFTDIRRHVDVR